MRGRWIYCLTDVVMQNAQCRTWAVPSPSLYLLPNDDGQRILAAIDMIFPDYDR